jgi:hypothetical protein
MAQLGLLNLIQRSDRDRVEQVLGAEADDWCQAKKAGRSFAPVFLAAIPEVETVLDLWLRLTKVRNDINHAGMREDAGEPDSLVRQVRECADGLGALPVGARGGLP